MTLCLHTIERSYGFKLLRAPISLFSKKLTASTDNEIQGSIHGNLSFGCPGFRSLRFSMLHSWSIQYIDLSYFYVLKIPTLFRTF